MYQAGREAFMFWTLAGVAAFIALALIAKSALTHFLQKRRAKLEQDEHCTSGHPT